MRARAAALVLVVACANKATPPAAQPVQQPITPCVRERPVKLRVRPDKATTVETPVELTLPTDILVSVIRSGKSLTMYEVSVCTGARPFVGHVARSTGFPELDRFLEPRVGDLRLVLPRSGCTDVTLVLGRFEDACDPPVFAL